MSAKRILRAISRVTMESFGILAILSMTSSPFDATELLAMAAIVPLLIVVEFAVMFSERRPPCPTPASSRRSS